MFSFAKSPTDIPCIRSLQAVADECLQHLPKKLREKFTIEVVVENFAETEILQKLSINDRYELLGLYRGVPVQLKQDFENNEPDTIFLYRCPLVRHAQKNRENMATLIQTVLANEIGHHFGISEAEVIKVRRQLMLSCQSQL